MTTIAYKDGVIAADTLMTWDGTRAGYSKKLMRQGRLILGFCGSIKNFEAFRSWVYCGMNGSFESKEGNVFIVPPSGPVVVWGDGDRPWREPQDSVWAMGSGERMALAAMAAGASAEEAVRIAAQIDCSTGGEIIALAH